jgi:threonine/homoserine/homoserine lactone efflux protein
MALVYAGMGIWLLLDDSFGIAPWNQILGAVFLVYGFWRGYRAGQSSQEN